MDSLFFYLSKLAWLIISPDTLLLILLLTTTVLFYLDKKRIARMLLSVVTAVSLFIYLFPVGEWLLYPLENRFQSRPALPEKIDGIIVLSGAENLLPANAWQQPELNQMAERDLAFMALARQYPEAKLVFTGGTGSLIYQQYRAADIAKEIFRQQQIDIKRIIFERDARNTWQNAVNSKKLAQPQAGQNWLLITTSWHMPRSVGIFCRNNWSVIPYPVDHSTFKGKLFRINGDFAGNLQELRTATKEWLGLLAYYISGKTTALLPGKC